VERHHQVLWVVLEEAEDQRSILMQLVGAQEELVQYEQTFLHPQSEEELGISASGETVLEV